MRMLMKVSFPVEAGNAAARSGTLGSTVKGILDDLKPEAAYFDRQRVRRTLRLYRLRHEGNLADTLHRGTLVPRLQRKAYLHPGNESPGPRERSVRHCASRQDLRKGRNRLMQPHAAFASKR